MNRAETYFQDVASLSRARPIGVTHEGVALVHMAWACGLVTTWCYVGLSHVKRTGATQSRRLLWRD
jgi:hypothetical protein